MNDIRNLEPKALWNNFYTLTRVPRPSGKREEIAKALVEYGKSLGLETLQDEIGNVLIRKPASPGCEHLPGVILQGHMDMVPQKATGKDFDFERDAIEAHVTDDGQWVSADRTTLGADNGIGVATAMTVLADKSLKHPPIEALFTIDEETGMYGAFDLKGGWLQGKTLLNLDSETEGELCVGCAGGVDANITFRYFESDVPEGDVALKVHVAGLHGGHSGCDIHLQRANANKLMFRFLKEAVENYEARLASVSGGTLRNAIPFECTAVITVPRDGVEDIKHLAEEFQQLFNREYDGVEDNITLTAESTDAPSGLIPEEIQDDLINAITACPHGVFRVIPEMPEIVETSNNVAVVESDGSSIKVQCLTRSSVESRKEELASMIESIFRLAGAKVELTGSYPGWKPNLQSPIMNTMKEVYSRLFGQEPKVSIIHAGLECGIIGRNYPGMDMISCGPTILHPHSPSEKVNIATVQHFWQFVTATLEQLTK